MWRRVLGRHNPAAVHTKHVQGLHSRWEMMWVRASPSCPGGVCVQKGKNLGLGASCLLAPPKPAVVDLSVKLSKLGKEMHVL